MDQIKYLQRINYQGSKKPSLTNLKQLMLNHLLHIPFENLDIHQQVPIILKQESIYEKIVKQHRGGFCYELNGLFCELLKSLGYQVDMISARVFRPDGSLTPEYDHLTLLIKIEDQVFLTDVGFGDFTIMPLDINRTDWQDDGRKKYQISADDDPGQFVVSSLKPGESVKKEYCFSKQAREFSDFTGMCHYHQSNPESHFHKKKICTILTMTGRITLAGNELKSPNDIIKMSNYFLE
ncbi:MAG: arylamine N-acetyltransferase family protein [Candidatus Cyclobacteriaceae bacterium M3_2C_046]